MEHATTTLRCRVSRSFHPDPVIASRDVRGPIRRRKSIHVVASVVWCAVVMMGGLPTTVTGKTNTLERTRRQVGSRLID